MSEDRSVYIRYIYDCICYVEAYTQGGKDEFFRDRKTQDAVIRNILAHQYLGVDLALTWEVVTNHLPALKQTIIAIARTMGIELEQGHVSHSD